MTRVSAEGARRGWGRETGSESGGGSESGYGVGTGWLGGGYGMVAGWLPDGYRVVYRVSGHLTYRHLTYTGVSRSYVRFVQKKQTYDLQPPVILVMNSVGVMSICEVLSRLKSLKKLSPPPP